MVRSTLSRFIKNIIKKDSDTIEIDEIHKKEEENLQYC